MGVTKQSGKSSFKGRWNILKANEYFSRELVKDLTPLGKQIECVMKCKYWRRLSLKHTTGSLDCEADISGNLLAFKWGHYHTSYHYNSNNDIIVSSYVFVEYSNCKHGIMFQTNRFSENLQIVKYCIIVLRFSIRYNRIAGDGH